MRASKLINQLISFIIDHGDRAIYVEKNDNLLKFVSLSFSGSNEIPIFILSSEPESVEKELQRLEYYFGETLIEFKQSRTFKSFGWNWVESWDRPNHKESVAAKPLEDRELLILRNLNEASLERLGSIIGRSKTRASQIRFRSLLKLLYLKLKDPEGYLAAIKKIAKIENKKEIKCKHLQKTK